MTQRTRVRVVGHALHPMLVVFPLGLLATSLLWDILLLATGAPMWGQVSFWTIAAGIAGALMAAVPGLVDWLGIAPGTRARRIGLWHMLLNLAMVGLFVLSAALRLSAAGGYAQAGLLAMLPGWIGIALAVVSGWLGGELVERLGVGVYEEANPDAPSSLGRGPHLPRPVT